MDWLALIGGFLLFLLFLGGAHGLDRHAADRFGYRPFALPNLALMLLPHGILVAWALGLAWAPDLHEALVPLLAALGAAALGLMLAILIRRTSPGMALVATLLMLAGASVLLPSMFFRDLAESPPGS